MRTAKRFFLILLLALLFVGAFLLNPLIRFRLYLETHRFDQAEALYRSQSLSTERFKNESIRQLKLYAERHVNDYYAQKATYIEASATLNALSKTSLPQEDVRRCLGALDAMEQARTSLAQAEVAFANADYGQAIPLYRQSLIADDIVALRLFQAEEAYRSQILSKANAAMDAGKYDAAKEAILRGLDVLGADDEDLSSALQDTMNLQEQQTYSNQAEEAERLLKQEGPQAAFEYMADLRQKAPDDLVLEYTEQHLRHAYEEDICSQALLLRNNGDYTGACTLLENGLLWIDSERMRILHAESMAMIPFWLCELPVLLDESADARTGEMSTVKRDQVHADIQSNQYNHSFWADLGSVSFALDERFALFVGTVSFPMGEISDIYKESASLQVFGDNVLLGEFKHLDSSSFPIPFSIPVEGVNELTITWTSEGANGWKDWGRFATIFDGRLLTALGASTIDQ